MTGDKFMEELYFGGWMWASSIETTTPVLHDGKQTF
jgi:hypothetical protein